METPSGVQTMSIINEFGRLIMEERKKLVNFGDANLLKTLTKTDTV